MSSVVNKTKGYLKIIRQILRTRQFRLLLYLDSIDPDYYTSDVRGDYSLEKKSPHPLFDPSYYRTRYLPEDLQTDPFFHFMKEGRRAKNKPGPFFDYDFFEKWDQPKKPSQNVLNDYLNSDSVQLRRPGLFFDVDWYLDKTPSLKRGNLDPLTHYKLYGAREGKSPIPVFDPDFYLDLVKNDPQAQPDPLAHYLTFGIPEDKPPCHWFDAVYYRDKYSGYLGGLYPLEHYLRKGVHEGVYVSEDVAKLTFKPVISLIVPVFNVASSMLNNCIKSVLYQQYPHWQLCLADDGSTRSGLKEELEAWCKRDSRITVVFSTQNRGISIASNDASSQATGEYLGFLDNDDELAPDCLYEVVKSINTTHADLVYTDEELIGDDGRRFTAFRKPQFNLELLLSHNYITHFVAVSRELFNSISGFRSEFDGAQDYDLMLRLSRIAKIIVHIPKILYYWRTTKTSTSVNHNQKCYAQAAGKNALQDYLDNDNGDGVAAETEINYFYRIKYPPVDKSVTVVIWCEQPDEQFEHYIELKRNTGCKHCQFWLISIDPSKPAFPFSYEQKQLAEGVLSIRLPADTRKARALHHAVERAETDYIGFLEESAVAVEPNWLDELVARIQTSGIMAVCGRVAFPHGDGPSFAVPEISDSSPRYFLSFITSSSRHVNGIHCPQSLLFCPWDVCVISKSTYMTLGGFDYDAFPSLFAMTDLGLRAAQTGQNIIYTPYSRVICREKQENSTIDSDLSLEEELFRFQKKWHDTLVNSESFYNSGLLIEHDISQEAFRNWLTGTVKSVMP